jgi:hypothetical protein
MKAGVLGELKARFRTVAGRARRPDRETAAAPCARCDYRDGTGRDKTGARRSLADYYDGLLRQQLTERDDRTRVP